jgi:hypothetical protein
MRVPRFLPAIGAFSGVAATGAAAGAIARLEGSGLASSIAAGAAAAVAFGYAWLGQRRKGGGKAMRRREPMSLRSSLVRSMILPSLLLTGALYLGSVSLAMAAAGLAVFWIAFLLWPRDRSPR